MRLQNYQKSAGAHGDVYSGYKVILALVLIDEFKSVMWTRWDPDSYEYGVGSRGIKLREKQSLTTIFFRRNICFCMATVNIK